MADIDTEPCIGKENYPEWKVNTFTEEFLKRKIPFLRKFLSQEDAVQSYKDGWVAYHADYIRCLANQYALPVLMLAGVAWMEVGGKPKFSDYMAFLYRSHVNSPNHFRIVDDNPALTSFGSVSIQLRRAAVYLGMDSKKLSLEDLSMIIGILNIDTENLEIVAKHLVDLTKVDYKDINPLNFTDEQIAIVCTRYNRGSEEHLKIIEANNSYGANIIDKKWYILALLR